MYEQFPKKGPSWASIVDAKPDDEGFSNITDSVGVQPVAVDGDNDAGRPTVAGKISHVSADGINPEIVGAKEHAKRRYKVSSAIGKVGTTGVTGSSICKNGPIREWVKTSRNGLVPPMGPKVRSEIAVPAMTVKLTGVEAGPFSDMRQSTPDLEGSAPPRPALSILGLGEDEFPPIRPMSDSGASIEASKLVFGYEKTRAGPEVNASLNSANTRSQPVRMGSRTDKGF